MDTGSTRTPYDVLDIAELLNGASRDDLVALLSATIDQVYFLRGQAAYAATLIERALEYKGFSTTRRPFGVKQVEVLTQMAQGHAEAAKFERQSHRVENAAKAAGIATWFRHAVPDVDTSGERGTHPDLRVGVGYALLEMLALRQVAAYEAGVARAHDIPSGPKGVRLLLEEADRTLALAIDADVNDLPEELRTIDRKAALRSAGARATLTNATYLVEHGLSLS